MNNVYSIHSQRDAEFERQRDLRRQLGRLLHGTLLLSPGRTYGPIDASTN